MDNKLINDKKFNFEKFKITKDQEGSDKNDINNIKQDSQQFKNENNNFNLKCKSNYFDQFDTDLRNNKKEQNVSPFKEKLNNVEIINQKEFDNIPVNKGSQSNKTNEQLKNQAKQDPFNINFNFNFTTETDVGDFESNNKYISLY